MGTLHAAVGDLNKVKRIVKLMSLVNSTGEFTEHHLVTNGASELLAQVFGEKGQHARSRIRRRADPDGRLRGDRDGGRDRLIARGHHG